MPKKAREARVPKSSLLDETNSLLPDNRNVQTDYYRLENREKQLEAVKNLGAEELAYIGGAGTTSDTVKKQLQQIHEKDLIELKILYFLNGLPDGSSELLQMKTWCGCDTREGIARFLADKQIKKLMMGQIEAIINIPQLTTLYKSKIKQGATSFGNLFG